MRWLKWNGLDWHTRRRSCVWQYLVILFISSSDHMLAWTTPCEKMDFQYLGPPNSTFWKSLDTHLSRMLAFALAYVLSSKFWLYSNPVSSMGYCKFQYRYKSCTLLSDRPPPSSSSFLPSTRIGRRISEFWIDLLGDTIPHDSRKQNRRSLCISA